MSTPMLAGVRVIAGLDLQNSSFHFLHLPFRDSFSFVAGIHCGSRVLLPCDCPDIPCLNSNSSAARSSSSRTWRRTGLRYRVRSADRQRRDRRHPRSSAGRGRGCTSAAARRRVCQMPPFIRRSSQNRTIKLSPIAVKTVVTGFGPGSPWSPWNRKRACSRLSAAATAQATGGTS